MYKDRTVMYVKEELGMKGKANVCNDGVGRADELV
jgi:hypothetical protein